MAAQVNVPVIVVGCCKLDIKEDHQAVSLELVRPLVKVNAEEIDKQFGFACLILYIFGFAAFTWLWLCTIAGAWGCYELKTGCGRIRQDYQVSMNCSQLVSHVESGSLCRECLCHKGSECEGDDEAATLSLASDLGRVNKASAKSVAKLQEIGPRMTL
ncbi:hypothetical protein Tco_1281961 [Tanacetum coccineum]